MNAETPCSIDTSYDLPILDSMVDRIAYVMGSFERQLPNWDPLHCETRTAVKCRKHDAASERRELMMIGDHRARRIRTQPAFKESMARINAVHGVAPYSCYRQIYSTHHGTQHRAELERGLDQY
jgi:hypothetical protein